MFLRRLTVVSLLLTAAVGMPLAMAQQAPATSSSIASEPGKVAATRMAEVSAGVVAVNKATRMVTLKGPEGKLFDVLAGDEVRNFDQIKVGDEVVVRYMQALAMAVRKGGGIRQGTESADAARTKPGDKPGAAVARQVSVLADVIDVNEAAKTITLKGPKGNVVELAVQNPDHFKVVKKGDQIEVDYMEAMAVAVVPAARK